VKVGGSILDDSLGRLFLKKNGQAKDVIQFVISVTFAQNRKWNLEKRAEISLDKFFNHLSPEIDVQCPMWKIWQTV
jgi:hypothetical protein